MQPTRRLWAALALAGGLALFAVITASPLALVGTGLIGAWILRAQYRFLRTVDATVESLRVRQEPLRSGIRTDEVVPVTLTATLERPSSLTLEIDAGVPTAGVADDSLTLSLEPGETGADRTVDISWPVAGRHTFDEPTVSVANESFRETIPVGNAPTVTAEPRGPRTIHVGEGGDRLAAAYGEHEGGRHGSGIEPAELREYMPGDTVDNIDWKATARLTTPYVREYEAETDRRTLLVVDHRSALATGERGETKLEYLRDIALTIAASARRLGDPIGFLGVGDDGITSRIEPATTPATHNRIRRDLLSLEPTTSSDDADADADADADTASRRPRASGARTTAADAREKLTAIGGDADEFASTLRPFYAARDGYRRRIESDPLYGAIKAATERETETHWTIICTDDSRPAELREAVTYARRNGNAVMVLLAPTVLYEPGSLADIERAYDRYLEFEQLRRDLAAMNRVTALEVGPRDRLSSVLSAGRQRRARGGYA